MIEMTLEKAIEHLADTATGYEVAADCERRIVASYAPEMEEWQNRLADKEPAHEHLTRKVRNCLEANSNAKRFDKDAHAIRTVLAALQEKAND